MRGSCGGVDALLKPRPEMTRATIISVMLSETASSALPAAEKSSDRKMTGRLPSLSER